LKTNKAWRKKRIQDLQVGGVWAFARWSKTDDSLLGGALLDEIARVPRGLPRGRDD